LKTLGEGDPLKMELAAELRKQTTITMVWIAKELNAGVPNRVWNAMRRLQDRGEVGTRE
jgi:DNA-binding Lrp family transcriptional regulator